MSQTLGWTMPFCLKKKIKLLTFNPNIYILGQMIISHLFDEMVNFQKFKFLS